MPVSSGHLPKLLEISMISIKYVFFSINLLNGWLIDYSSSGLEPFIYTFLFGMIVLNVLCHLIFQSCAD